MAKHKKKKINDGEEQQHDSTKKEDIIPNVVVLKADQFHCHGCASKVFKCIRSFDGVEAVAMREDDKIITVVGKVDPAKLRDVVEEKTHKKVEIISPKSKQDADGGKGNSSKMNNNKSKGTHEKSDDKKSKEKEPPVTTVTLKINLHCEGCIGKIHKAVSKTKGVHHMKVDGQKNLLTVTGAVEGKALADSLKKQLKKDVEIVKVDGEKKDGKENTTGGCGAEKSEGKRLQQAQTFENPDLNPYPVVYCGAGISGDPFQYNPFGAPQMFSDENPNACRVM